MAWNEEIAGIDGCKFEPKGPGTQHPVFTFIAKARQVFLKLGFQEVMVPVMVDEAEIYFIINRFL